MPRSIQEILDHADELARRLEEYEPAEGDERPVEDYLLQRAALARARSERQVVEAVVAARAAGISWGRIGELLGTSAQAAQQRYGALVELAEVPVSEPRYGKDWDALRTTLTGTVSNLRSLAELAGWVATKNSPFSDDVRLAGTTENGEPWANQVSSLALLRLVAIEDGLTGIAGLIGKDGGVFVPWVAARFTIESAALMWWLLEPGLDPMIRIARALTDRVRSLQESWKVEREMGLEDPLSPKRLASIRSTAEELGLDFAEPKSQPWSVGGQHRPGKTDLVADMFSQEHLPGRVVYRYLAGISHGEPFALMQHMSSPAWATESGHMVQPQMTLESTATLVASTLLGVVPAVDRLVPYLGWDERGWQGWKEHAVKVAFQYLADIES